ncbi:MAG TPA: hypothetical protein GX404_10135 [Syntrophomonadaceae bacterium]|nr:hypothetical protein [Syntrophomonadaceae bacterium]
MVEKEQKENKTGLKILSVILAILLWIYVVNLGGQGATKNVVETSLEYRNLGEDLTVTGPEKVSVKLWGAYTDSSNIVAYVDLAGYEKGTHTVPVQVEPVKGAMFTSVEPDKVEVTLDSVKEKTVNIQQEIRQNPPAGLRVSEISIYPEKCIVKGDRDLVARVAAVIAVIDLGEVRDVAAMKVALQARDARGKPITAGLQIVPQTVDVYVVLSKELAVKSVKVNPQLLGNPAPGFVVSEVIVDPAEVVLRGKPSQLNAVTEISTQAINIDGASGQMVQLVHLNIPAGLTASTSQVSVQIRFEQSGHNEVQE